MQTAGKVFVVTGAGNGIGREVALELVAQGAIVAAVDINEDGLRQTADVAGTRRISTHVLDISDDDAVAAFPQTVIDAHGAVDGLFNIAGIAQDCESTSDITSGRIDALMGVNFHGTVAMTRAFLPHLAARPEGGRIMLTSSMSALVPVPGAAVYGASKAAVAYFGYGLAQDLRRQSPSVKATTVIPGTIWTDIVRNTAQTMGVPVAAAKTFAMPARKAAKKMIAATMKGRTSLVIGKDAHFYRGLTRISSRLAERVSYVQVGTFVYRQNSASGASGADSTP
ncbi:SDR family oxidoreductase [Gordonia sp. HY002]|uniref:SDR family NAD(P)-dependent oxidoreductase n=1 Tax=Gordonia zhenghanii TaxID=2911516 RepID=UPI001EF124F4|nr:SDR family oxidoreductase [Gordonia zhenghanii]MCF8571665.1 SDR family oxidoreductase [Gordonia zhenghanii]MCF8602688.1 SDR family oxidoreductase [Gordonia zhenghanii]